MLRTYFCWCIRWSIGLCVVVVGWLLCFSIFGESFSGFIELFFFVRSELSVGWLWDVGWSITIRNLDLFFVCFYFHSHKAIC